MWWMTEADIVYCIAEVFRKNKWHCLFEWCFMDGGHCDLIAAKKNEKNIWIECKWLRDYNFERPNKKTSIAPDKLRESKKDIGRLQGIKGSRAYFVILVQLIRSEKNTGERLRKWLNSLGIDYETDGIKVNDKGGKSKIRQGVQKEHLLFVVDAKKLRITQ